MGDQHAVQPGQVGDGDGDRLALVVAGPGAEPGVGQERATLAPWQEVEAGGVTITATPAKHGVYEVTFVLRSGPEAVYFAGDTMLIPELGEIPQRLGHISLALLPTNGLHIRPASNMQVVMNAQEAAELTAILKPELAIPHHYAFTKGFLGDRLITSSDKNPQRYQDASRDVAPRTSVRIVEPGTRVEL
jgi:L-ascorbate metabolism protein UlaG (beta-lactamase superfamily)